MGPSMRVLVVEDNPDMGTRLEQGLREHGFAVEYFNTPDLSGSPVETELSQTSELMWFGGLPQPVNPEQFSVRCTARFTPQETGPYMFGLVSAGLSRLYIDGREVIDNWTQQTLGEYFGMGSTEVQAVVPLEAGRQYLLTLEFSRSQDVPLAAV